MGTRNARYEVIVPADEKGSWTSKTTVPSCANSVYSGWSPHPAK